MDERRLCGGIDVKPTLIQGDPTLHTILGYFTDFLLAKELLDYSFQVKGWQRVHEGLCAATCGEETESQIGTMDRYHVDKACKNVPATCL